MLCNDPIYLVVTNHSVQINQRRIRGAAWSLIMSRVNVRCVAVVVGVPGEIRRGERSIIDPRGRAYAVMDGYLR